MASSTSDSASASPESQAIRCHFSSLAKAITDPLKLSMELFSSRIIEDVTMEEVDLPNQTITKKNRILLSAVMRRVEARPSLFHCFVDLLKDNSDHVLSELGGKLGTTCNEYSSTKEESSSIIKQVQCSLSTSTQQIKYSTPTQHTDQLLPSPTKHLPPPLIEDIDYSPLPPTKQIKHSFPPPMEQIDYSPPPPATHSSLLALSPQSPVRRYADYLKAFYQTSELPACDTWPLLPSNVFINLAVISREEVSHTDVEKFMLATLHGGVDEIIDIKAPIEIGDILDTQPGKLLQCILVEGAPGVGKSTLAWEACKQWGKGNLFQQFAFILLLRLRDQTVQNANSITDLVFNQDQDCLQDITQHFKDSNGRNILIILEGLDELPKHLLTQHSIFTRLLSGVVLPLATILVTSRPSATVHLWQNWKHRICRHIEVLGFTEENITQYIKSVLSPKELHGFQNYISINPHIRTIMYIPLHAAIVTEVYKMCQNSSKALPTTITELYTCFVQTVLLRYITSQADYRDLEQEDLDKFTNLPPPVNDHFYELAQLAYNGVIDQKLIIKDQRHTIMHLGFMNGATELFPNKLRISYTYSFLHLSIQEYLAAYYVSKMAVPQQEQLLERMCTETHLRNMGRFLAGITKFKDMDRTVVKKTIDENCKTTENIDWKDEAIQISTHALQLLYEIGSASVLGSNHSYGCPLTDHNPLFDFFMLGYCITQSNCKWRLQLGTLAQFMKSTERIQMLVKALKSHSNSSCTYSIERIACYYDVPACVEQLLTVPENVLQQIRVLGLLGNSENHPQLPECVPKLILTMSSLSILVIASAVGATVVHRAMQAVAKVASLANTLKVLALTYCEVNEECVTTFCQWLPTSSQLEELQISLPSPDTIKVISTAFATNSTVKTLDLSGSKFNLLAMQELSSMLTHNNTITKVKLVNCHMNDDIFYSLAECLHFNYKITILDVRCNAISDKGALFMAKMLMINSTLQEVYLSENNISNEGKMVLVKENKIKA